jgi:Flp pilus assembly CpaE family ATPase
VLSWLSAQPHKEHFVVQWTDSLTSAIGRLGEGHIDLILMDLGLPDSTGLATFSAIRSRAADLPIVVLSSGDEEALALDAIQQGAQDYLIKPSCTADLLARTLRHAAARHQSAPKGSSASETPRAKIAGVVGGTGGVGTTTIASILAAEVARQSGQKTLLMDLDCSPGLVAFTSGVDLQYSVADAIARANEMDLTIWEDLVGDGEENLDILGCARNAVPLEYDIASLRETLAFASGIYRWIVIDLGRLSYVAQQVFRSVDERFLVTGPEIPALHQCKRVLEMLEMAGFERDHVRLILNRKDSANRLSLQEIRKLFGIEINATLPPSHDDLYKACLRKQLPPVSSEIRISLAALARNFAGLPDPQPKRGRGLTGVFRNLAEATAK